MGLKDYFKPEAQVAPEVPTTAPALVEKQADASLAQTSNPRNPAIRSTSTLNDRDSRFINGIKYEIILNFLYQKQCASMWIDDTSGQTEGTMLRRSRGEYMCCPPALANSRMAHVIAALNVQVAMTVRSRVINTFLAKSTDAVDVPISNGLRIQIVNTIDDLIRARKLQYAAFISSESLLVVWDDDPSNMVKRVEQIEADLLRMVWLSSKLENQLESKFSEKEGVQVNETEIVDEEANITVDDKRPIMLYNCVLVSLSLCLLIVLIGLGYQKIANEVSELHEYLSCIFVIMTPINLFLTLFFASVIISALAQMFGPVRHVTINSKFFSAIPPIRLSRSDLPHVTIQCPVYKEGLAAVIIPTIRSIRQAISTYELQGGTANIFINDDGLQIISEAERQARIDFYADNNIGWTARPKHGLNGFIRKGKFKKASNMNYGLAISNKVEERLQLLVRDEDWNDERETAAYELVLKEVLEQTEGAWAQGNIRVGDYVLLIDSDTEVPADCFLDAVSEMEQSPDVAIIQFSSGVMQVAHDFFENGITFFTNMIYTAIRFGVAAGDVAPFVGHNAILRWSAIQKVSFEDEDGQERFWSEVSVSEDFDMALRLQVQGYIVRMAAWAGDGFKEGVSLTVYDELTRWEKYAYGCDELMFHPLKYWLFKGPITPLFWRFVCSGMPIGSKLNIISYIGTYYAIASAWVYTLANYIAVGLYNGYLDKWYVESWKIWLSIIIVFSVAGNVALAVQRYRLGERSFLSALYENFKWSIMFVIFFGGMSLHVSQAILSHMLSIDMQWGATAKEVENSNFFTEVPKVLKKFKWSLLASLLGIVAMVVMAVGTFIPWSWNITQFVAIFPLAMLCACHMLLPIVLNPGLMTFTW